MAGGGPEATSKSQGQTNGSLSWHKDSSELHLEFFFPFTISWEEKSLNQMPHNYKSSQSSYFGIKLHFFMTEL